MLLKMGKDSLFLISIIGICCFCLTSYTKAESTVLLTSEITRETTTPQWATFWTTKYSAVETTASPRTLPLETTAGPVESSQDVTEDYLNPDFYIDLIQETDAPIVKRTLNAVRWIGSSLSVVGLVACVLTLTLIKSLRVKQPTKIHVNFCLCLIGFYVSFLAGDLSSPHQTHCKNTSAAIQYFALSTVGWMTVEAVNMYFLFVKYETMSIQYFIPVSCVLVYGYPLIPVLIAVCLTSPDKYDCCFLPPTGSGHFYGFLFNLLVLVGFNITIFLLVIRKVVFRKIMITSAEQNRKKEIIARIRQFVLFWVLLGPSWIFGFLSILPNREMFFSEILFCICTSLQGFVLFLFVCVRNPEVKKKLCERRHSNKNDSHEME
ncbi:adhesion G protein-coupled receptor E5-like [Apostichopus japonicus]|uniref:adhesion G protein-coupled receptor E5-like n=1 Tax=Stichopus japonicus TaxID=307972 RepID=UPI003AB6F364